MNPQRVLCDCCQERPWTRYGIVHGIETNYCGVCTGLTPEEAEEEWQENQVEPAGEARVSSNQQCRICNTSIPFTRRSRYICCNGIDCGCYGATFPDDICSESCLQAADVQKEKETEGGVML